MPPYSSGSDDDAVTMGELAMIQKLVDDVAGAVRGVETGSTILVSGFGEVGSPTTLLEGLLDTDARDLTIVANNAGVGERGIAALMREGRVRKIICSYPRSAGSIWFERRYQADEIELELVPQGTLSERIRAGGAGLGGFFTSTGVGTLLAAGKPTREVNGRTYVLEEPITGDFSFIGAHTSDRWGNLTYRAAARNFGPTMVTAGAVSVVQVTEYVEVGKILPEGVITPGVYVDRILVVDDSGLDREVRAG
jgi:3-oxoadipate CoA-transferase alpha subunit